FKVITLETTASESYYRLVFHDKQFRVSSALSCRIFATSRSTLLRKPRLALGDDPAFRKRGRDAFELLVVVDNGQMHGARLTLAFDLVDLCRPIQAQLVFRLVYVQRHGRP